jgi:hypothetical protein
VGGAAEDEQPVDLGQTSQLDLAQWAGLLQPTEGLLDIATAAGYPTVAAMITAVGAGVAVNHMVDMFKDANC